MYNEFMPSMMMELQIAQTIFCLLLSGDTYFFYQVRLIKRSIKTIKAMCILKKKRTTNGTIT